MPDSPILEQIKSDDGVAGSRARKEAVRESARPPGRLTNHKGTPASRGFAKKSPPQRGYASLSGGKDAEKPDRFPAPNPASATVSRLGVTNGDE
jgi:hypothetical protein